MTLEFEKLTGEINQMAQNAERRQQDRLQLIEQALETLRRYATEWGVIDRRLDMAESRVDIKKYRSAKPSDRSEPLDAAVDPPRPPDEATIIGVDGSQIAPDHHASFLYSLINIGVMVYIHGHQSAPIQFTRPFLDYPGKEEEAFTDSGAIVNLRRDQAEIETLGWTAWAYPETPQPLLALLDQRLLYWPAVGGREGNRVLQKWQAAMSALHQLGALLAGYIVRPRKQSVMTMLDAMRIEDPDFDPKSLEERDMVLGLPDAALFARILGPGQRSRVFLDISDHNNDFRQADPLNEVGFFYFNPGRTGRRIARVDIPWSVARNPKAVAAVHALLADQCRILGDYPYVLARADEIAVVGRLDQESLNMMIEQAMGRAGLQVAVTAKQSAKDVARAGRTRHEV
jgi:hypothetical protein